MCHCHYWPATPNSEARSNTLDLGVCLSGPAVGTTALLCNVAGQGHAGIGPGICYVAEVNSWLVRRKEVFLDAGDSTVKAGWTSRFISHAPVPHMSGHPFQTVRREFSRYKSCYLYSGSCCLCLLRYFSKSVSICIDYSWGMWKENLVHVSWIFNP